MLNKAAVLNVNEDEIHKKLWQNKLNEEDYTLIFADNMLKGLKKQKSLESLEYGSNAHITLGFSSQVEANQSGIDLLKIKLFETMSNNNKKFIKYDSGEKEYIYFDKCYSLVKLKIEDMTILFNQRDRSINDLTRSCQSNRSNAFSSTW